MFICFCPKAQSKKRVMATVAATVGAVTLGAEVLLPMPQAVGTRKQQPVQLHLPSQPPCWTTNGVPGGGVGGINTRAGHVRAPWHTWTSPYTKWTFIPAVDAPLFGGCFL